MTVTESVIEIFVHELQKLEYCLNQRVKMMELLFLM
jgi:hypothetical protein